MLGAAAAGRAEPSPEPSPEAVLATLPFLPSDANRVLIDLAPPGMRPLPMLLDTGAGGSVMTPLMARQLGVSVRRSKSSPYRRKTLLGRDLQFWVDTSTSDTGSKTGFEYGLLGGDFLDRYVVEIDFPGHQVRFLDADEFEVPEAVSGPDETVVPLRITARRPFVELEIDGAPVRVLLDTGAPPPLLVAGSEARKLGIEVDSLPDFGRMGFVLGSTEARLHEASVVRLGSFGRGPVPVIIVPRGSFNLGGATDSLAGYDLLAPFVVRIDYPRQRMWMRRAAPLTPTLYGMDYVLGREVGAFLTRAGDDAIVLHVKSGGLAHRYGLRTGDRVVSDGDPVSPESVAKRARAGEPLTVFRERDGSWFEVMLPDVDL